MRRNYFWLLLFGLALFACGERVTDTREFLSIASGGDSCCCAGGAGGEAGDVDEAGATGVAGATGSGGAAGAAGAAGSPTAYVRALLGYGQSNMVGQRNRLAAWPVPNPPTVHFYLGATPALFQPGYVINDQVPGATKHEGIECELGLTLSQRTAPVLQIEFAKAAKDATALWDALPAQTWPTFGFTGGAYNTDYQAAVHLLAGKVSAGETIYAIQMQGEAESSNLPSSTIVTGYGGVMTQLFAYTRGLEPTRHFKYIVILTNANLIPSHFPGLGTIRASQVSACAADSDCISIDRPDIFPPDAHYQAAEYESIGRVSVAPVIP